MIYPPQSSDYCLPGFGLGQVNDEIYCVYNAVIRPRDNGIIIITTKMINSSSCSRLQIINDSQYKFIPK